MSFISAFAGSLNGDNCGLTVDVHRGTEGHEVIQYLWAAPAEKLDDSQISELSQAVAKAAANAGFIAGDTSPYVTSLPNEIATLDSCPFQPQACSGKHLVISGSGLANKEI